MSYVLAIPDVPAGSNPYSVYLGVLKKTFAVLPSDAAVRRIYALVGLNGLSLFLGLAYLGLLLFDAKRKRSSGTLWFFRLVERPSGRYIASNRYLLSGIIGVVASAVNLGRLGSYLNFSRSGSQLGAGSWGAFQTIPLFIHIFIISSSNLQAYLLLPERYDVPVISARVANGLYVIGGSIYTTALLIASTIIGLYGDRAWYSYQPLVEVLTTREISWNGSAITLVDLLALAPYLTTATTAVSLYRNSIIAGAGLLCFGPFVAALINLAAISLTRTLRNQIQVDLEQLVNNESQQASAASAASADSANSTDTAGSGDSEKTLVGKEEKKGSKFSRREIRKIAKGTASGSSGLEGEAAKHIAMLQKAERDLLLMGVFLFCLTLSSLILLLWTTIQWGRSSASGLQWTPIQTEICLFGILWIYSISVSITFVSLIYNAFVHLPPAIVDSEIRPTLPIRALTLNSNCTFCGSALLKTVTYGEFQKSLKGKGKARREENARASTCREPYDDKLFLLQTKLYQRPKLSKSGTSKSKSTLANLKEAIESRNSEAASNVFSSISWAEQQEKLDRSTFDSLFNLFAFSDSLVLEEDGTRKVRRAWGDLKALYLYTLDNDWVLSTDQLRTLLKAGLHWEALRTAKWFSRLVSSREAGLVSEPLGVPKKELVRRGQLERIRRKLMGRLDKSEAQIKEDRKLDEHYTVLLHQRISAEAVNTSEATDSTLTSIDQPEVATSTTIDLLRHFEKGESLQASIILHTLIDNNEVPGPALLRKIISVRDSAALDTYEQARKILDNSSSSSGSDSTEKDLDALLQQRLDRIDREEWRLAEPRLAFVKWIALDQPTLEVSQLEWSFLALRLWESIYATPLSIDQERRNVPYLAHQLLHQLVTTLCNFESDTPNNSAHYRRTPSPALTKAISLVTTHLNDEYLLSVSSRLLKAITVTSPSPILARNLYYTLRTKLPPNEAGAFLWQPSLRDSFVYLFRIVAATSSQNQDAAFALQLYLDYTADGLKLPVNLWSLLWQAMGKRGSVEETSRVLADYDQIATIQSKHYDVLMKASARSGRIVNMLRLLEFINNRRADAPLSIETYNVMLEVLAATYQDRRPDALRIFHSILAARIRPTIETWNALLANYVFRPRITMKDLNGSGNVYNSIITAGALPNRMTYSLLIHGFLRIASEGESLPQVRNFGIEAAYRTFETAIESGNLVRGWQVGQLVEGLGNLGSWDRAKGVGESWWKLNLSIEALGSEGANQREHGEESYLMKSAEKVINWEREGRKVKLPISTKQDDSELESLGELVEDMDSLDPEDEDRFSDASFSLNSPSPSSTISTFTPNSLHRPS